MAETTKKPSGLSIVRDSNLKFVMNWKIADKDYGGGHQLRWRTWHSEKYHSAWTEVKMGNTTTTKAISLTASDWYPTTNKHLHYFEVEVRGKRNTANNVTYEWSDWASKKWEIQTPAKPKITATASTSETPTQKTTFAWVVNTDSADNKPFANIQWQTIFKKACKETNGKNLSWKSSANGWDTGTSTSTSSSTSKTEDTTTLASGSYTRWFRFRTRGARGASDWVYAKHVYAMPYKAEVLKTKATKKGSDTNIYVKWKAQTNAAHPIDETITEYYFGVPVSGAIPSGASGTEGAVTKDTSGSDAVNIVVSNTTIQEDQCLWVRVNNKHDKNTRNGDWTVVKKGKVAAPTGLTVSYNTSNAKVSVTALTNNSDIADSKTAIIYKSEKKKLVIAVVNKGATLPTGIQCPTGCDAPAFGAYTFHGTATAKTANGITSYSVNADMKSDTYWLAGGGTIPVIPSDFTAEASGREGEALLTWSWSWSSANQAEISWSTNEYAWESTDEPSTYTVDNILSAQWRVSGLETGKVYYFRMRLAQVTDDGTIYSGYTDLKEVDLSSAPNKPVMSLDKSVMAAGSSLTATWGYTTTDGTEQMAADVCTATVSGSTVSYGTIIAHAQTAQHVTFTPSGWTAGNDYYLCVRVTSASGLQSEWSDPVPVLVAEPLTATLSQSSLSSTTVDSRTFMALTSMPMTATITGAGAGGTTTLIIERVDDYHMVRPDDSMRDGYDGETIYVKQQTGEGQFTINVADLYGTFDHQAKYRLIGTVEDGFGQSSTITQDFEVKWSSLAVAPTVSVVADGTIAKITPTAGTNTPSNSTCDIYRLSVDAPQLIKKGAAFGTTYVDPFPALGEHAGYRCVCITPNGDYITSGNQPAWTDYEGQLFDNATGLIDFNGIQIPVQFNVKLGANWKKDFKETRYLGGTIRGDWNPGVSRSSTIGVTIPTYDTETIEKMRRLADWNGICHVRSQDGSSYSADVQVSSSTSYSVAGKVEDFSLSITRIEPEALDGMSLAEWNNTIS